MRSGSPASGYFDAGLPDRLAAYLATLRVTQGPLAGQGLEVLPWQEDFLRGAFAPGITDAGLSVARGNGKTSLLAGIALACVEGPLMQPRAETVIIAASFEQAGILFDTALAYGTGRVTGMHYRILNSQNRKLIEHLPSGARLRVMSSDPKRAHGIAPALILADEPAQWPTGTGEQMVAALRTSRGKIAGSHSTKPVSYTHLTLPTNREV